MHIPSENMLQLFVVDTLLSRRKDASIFQPQVKKQLEIEVEDISLIILGWTKRQRLLMRCSLRILWSMVVGGAILVKKERKFKGGVIVNSRGTNTVQFLTDLPYTYFKIA